jgi:hypothetical protein
MLGVIKENELLFLYLQILLWDQARVKEPEKPPEISKIIQNQMFAWKAVSL